MRGFRCQTMLASPAASTNGLESNDIISSSDPLDPHAHNFNGRAVTILPAPIYIVGKILPTIFDLSAVHRKGCFEEGDIQFFQSSTYALARLEIIEAVAYIYGHHSVWANSPSGTGGQLNNILYRGHHGFDLEATVSTSLKKGARSNWPFIMASLYHFSATMVQ